MSDSVNYLVGTTAGRDHIMWPTILQAQIPQLSPFPDPSEYDFIWPADCSLLQIMALAWKVKQWRLTGSLSVSKTRAGQTISGTADVDETEIFIRKFDNDLGIEVAITREAEILYHAFTMPFGSSAFRFLGNDGIGPVGSDEPTIDFDWSTTGNVNGNWSGTNVVPFGIFGTWPVIFNTPNFAPPCSGLGEIIPAIIAGNQLIASVEFCRSPVTALTGPILLQTPGTLTVNPGITPTFDIPLQLSWRFLSDATGGSGTGSAAFTLEATDFWFV